MGQITRTRFGLVKTKTLTNAQMLTLAADTFAGNGPIVIPAIAGKIVFPVAALFRLKGWVADYASIDAAATLKITTGGIAILTFFQEAQGGVTDLLAFGENSIGSLAVCPFDAAEATSGLAGIGDINTVNTPTRIELTNGAGVNLTGGNVAQSLVVSVYYNVFPA